MRTLDHVAAGICAPALAVWLLLSSGCTSISPNPAQWNAVPFLAEEAPVGTPEWWKKHESKARFVVKDGEPMGYAVEGYEGYFDQNGQPIDKPVTTTTLFAEESEGILPDFKASEQLERVKVAVGFGPDEETARVAFAEAEGFFQAERYGKAASRYQEAADRTRDARLQQDALMMVAESYFFDNRYTKARDAYNALVAKYPNTSHLDELVERQWEIAQYWEKHHFHDPKWVFTPNALDRTRPINDTVGHALKTYENIRMNDPTGPRADDAIMATAGIHFRRQRYDDADYHYTLLRREYPRSEFQFDAHLLGLQAKLRKYQGADYDGTALEEAKRLAKQLKVQFAGRLSGEERERLKTVDAELNRQIALRDVKMASYYDGKREYGAARYYYAEVIQRHPDSELAQDSRLRLAEIASEPDSPPERLAWFTDLFPESRERTRVARIPELQKGGQFVASNPETPAGEGNEAPDAATSTR